MILAAFSLTTFAACGKKHESDGKYHSDEAYHWTGCKACKNHTYNKSAHEFTQDGTGKKCKICGYTVEATDEENFTDFYRAYVNSIEYNGDYTYKAIYEETDPFTKKIDLKVNECATRSGDKYLYRNEKTNIFGDDESNIVTVVTVDAVKQVVVDGNLRLKRISIYTNPSNTESRGVLKKPSFTVDTIALYPPNEWFREFLISTTVNTYDEFVAAFTAAYSAPYEYEGDVELSQITLARNEDDTLSFRFTSTCVYVDESYFYQGIDTYKNTKEVSSYEIVADENHIVKINIENVYSVNYTDGTSQTTLSTDNMVYGYEFDNAEYDKISVDTDTTDDEYVSTINFYVNGYLYAYSMDDLKIGSTVTLDEVKQYLADIGENGSKPLFNQDVDPDMFAIYTDKDKTQAFTSLVINEESYTLYAEIVVPEGKAVVMVLREYDDVRGIYLCYVKDLGGTFKTSNLGKTYPLIEVDGEEITDGSTPEITCDESRIYVVVCKVR